MNFGSTIANNTPPSSKLRAWRNALAITFLGCVLVGLGCFVALGNYLLREVESLRLDLFRAAIRWEGGFAVAMAAILAVIVARQRSQGGSLKDLGWARPTTRNTADICWSKMCRESARQPWRKPSPDVLIAASRELNSRATCFPPISPAA